jgi:hypothetical protein
MFAVVVRVQDLARGGSITLVEEVETDDVEAAKAEAFRRHKHRFAHITVGSAIHRPPVRRHAMPGPRVAA